MEKTGAILIAVLIILAAFSGYAVGYFSQRTPSANQTATQPTSEVTLYEIIFSQTGVCSPPVFLAPWSVTLENKNYLVEPPNSNLSECCTASPSSRAYSTIVFSLPDGSYGFTISPNLLSPQRGTVSVSGHDVTVQVSEEIASCGSATTSTG